MVCCMRAYSFVSIVALLIYLVALISGNFSEIYNNDIRRNKFLKDQLSIIDNSNNKDSILVYGSSGVLLGLSAQQIMSKTGHVTMNLSTEGLGGQIDKFIDLISTDKHVVKVIIIGDRSYRKSNLIQKNNMGQEILEKLLGLTFFPNIKSLFIGNYVANTNRSEFGDLLTYPKGYVKIKKEISPPIYTINNVKLMKTHNDKLLATGICPILVYVPLLVKKDDLVSNSIATERLNWLLRIEGIDQYVAKIPMIETDKSLFIDNAHMSDLGREKWTHMVTNEILNRNMCNLAEPKK